MAILQDQNASGSICSSKTSNLSSSRSNKNNFSGKDSTCSRSSRLNRVKDIKSPYLSSDKIQLLTRVTEKKLSKKKPNEMISSFPLAVNVYRSNSDELKKSKRVSKKSKKSVLTLPNEPAPIPKIYTVSDLNDCDYNDANDRRATKTKKRRVIKRNKKPRVKDRVMEYYDRDARFCSQLNIDLDCSSSEIVNYNGDGERISKQSYRAYNQVDVENDPHDVWAVLRNINKLQFRPTSTTPASPESVMPLRKKKILGRKGSNNRNDTRIIETCHTEEFAYISSFEIDSKSRGSCSPSSSFDRVTVIDKQSDRDEIIIRRNNFESNIMTKQNQERNKLRLKNRNNVPYSKAKIKNSEIVANKVHYNIPSLKGNYKHEKADKNIVDTAFDSELCDNLDTSIIRGNNISPKKLTKDFDNVDRSGDNKFYKVKALVKNPINNTKFVDNSEQVSNITEVILNKGEVSPKLIEPERKPRLALTLPKTSIPNLSQIEIRRRLAHLKFPIVILGKDQITNQAIHVENYDPPHLNGLDQHIWPFMLRWSEENNIPNIQNGHKKEILRSKQKNLKVKHKLNNSQSDLFNFQSIISKSDKHVINMNGNIVKTHNINNVPLQMIRKPKAINNFKDKMFGILQKSAAPKKGTDDCSNYVRLKTNKKDVIVGTSEILKNEINHKVYAPVVCVPSGEFKTDSLYSTLEKKTYSAIRHPWAKAKRASDFIENIIKKIRSGVYYSGGRREIKCKINATEASTQTAPNYSRNAYCQNNIDSETKLKLVLNKKDDPLKDIPGFDNNISTLKIETISEKQIAVKHCVTNVVVQFDVQILTEANNIIVTRNTMSSLPLYLKNKQQKIFKCNTSIHNAILPAELCSLIPIMMRSILDAEKKLYIPPKTVGKVESNLMVISEFSGSKNPDIFTHLTLPGLVISDQTRPMLKGRFSPSRSNSQSIKKTVSCLSTTRMDSTESLFSGVNPQVLAYFNKLFTFVASISLFNSLMEPQNGKQNKVSNCMALQTYEPRRLSIVPFAGIFNSAHFIQQIIDKCKVNERLYTKCQDIKCSNRTLSLIFPVLGSECNNNIEFASNHNIGIISLFNAFNNSFNGVMADATINTLAQTDIENRKAPLSSLMKNETKMCKKRRLIKISRTNSYIKCYRKCKSMSNISSYKSTPLSRITNIEEFLQSLGSRSLSRVLDGRPEKKVLAAVNEMKNWITEITPKQALLVLLLINKKDTPNLIRFRPVLLQGIAVNRITRAVELDTEIEVIEREHFNILSQFEGISYLPASAENQDSLFEELYWIAKTTASDYQKKFDETSEKLLKSLLEKRKKLNPSYLRVMARYVGLGLLTRLK